MEINTMALHGLMNFIQITYSFADWCWVRERIYDGQNKCGYNNKKWDW